MFLDASRAKICRVSDKTRDQEEHKQQRQHQRQQDTSQPNGNKLNSKLVNIRGNLKNDLCKRMSRLLGTGPSGASNSDRGNQSIVKEAKSSWRSSSTSLLRCSVGAPQQNQVDRLDKLRRNCASFKDSPSGRNSNIKANKRTSRLLLNRNSSLELHAPSNWVPNLKRSLNRTLSWHQQGTSHRQVPLSEQTRRRLHCGATSAKRTWLSQQLLSRVPLMVALFVLVAVILKGPGAYGAPLTSVQPIWLNDGLINLDVSGQSFDGAGEQLPVLLESPVETELESYEANVDETNLLERPDIELDRQALDRESWRDKIKNAVRPTGGRQTDVDGLGQEQELFWIQRRRLNRDRALEPAPWLREQPMRRNSDPPSADGSLVEGPADLYSPRSARGRQSRQSASQIYEEILRHLLEEALDDQAFLDELYDELEQRISAKQASQRASQQLKQPSSSDSGLPSSGRQSMQDVGDISPVLMPQQIQMLDNNAATQGQDQSQDSGLIVASDEVASSEDESGEVDNSRQPVRLAKLTLTDTLKQQADEQPATGGSMGSDGSIIVNYGNDEPSQQSAFIKQQQQEQPSSFHVIEDIDQAEIETVDQPEVNFNGRPLDGRQPQVTQFTEQQAHGMQARPVFDKRLSRMPTGPSRLDETGDDDLSFGPRMANKLEVARAEHMAEEIESADSYNMMIEMGNLNRRQLRQLATKFRTKLEDFVGVSRGSILALYPLSANKLLIRLDGTKLSALQKNNLIRNFNFARNFILLDWPRDSKLSPMPLLSAILQSMASKETSGKFGTGELERLKDTGRPQFDGSYNGLDDDTDTIEMVFAQEAPIDQANYDQLLAGSQHILDQYNYDGSRYAAPSGQGRLSIALLSAYLNALKTNRLKSLQDPLPVSVALASDGAALHASDASVVGNQRGLSGSDLGNLTSNHQLVAFVLALLGALVMMKLLMQNNSKSIIRRHLDRMHRGSFRSLWSSASEDSGESADTKVASHAAIVTSGKQPMNLEAGQQARHLSSESSVGKSFDDKSNLDLLTRKLLSLIINRRSTEVAEATPLDSKENDKIEASELVEPEPIETLDTDDKPSRFRTSRSYIKSLIEILSKASTQLPSGRFSDPHTAVANDADPSNVGLLVGDGSVGDSNRLELVTDLGKKSLSLSNSNSNPLEQSDQVGADILQSQMDISAAHLILAYMEQHLEDKERLRREWLELNGELNGGKRSTEQGGRKSSCSAQVNTKISQLFLQRMAKVALSDENMAKNRNPSVVPFDKNRVKLNKSAGVNGKRAAVGSRRAGQARQRDQTQEGNSGASDYINASFIHDDDPHRPTHIIAQGPCEQTVGQFWQMVWEQGISVIVMLTRLNEDSVRMCHCYWPTASNDAPPGEVSTSSSGTNNDDSPTTWLAKSTEQTAGSAAALVGVGGLTTTTSTTTTTTSIATTTTTTTVNSGIGNGSGNGRRSSVTSVFNTNSARLLNSNGQPIIANGDLANNVLYFEVGQSRSAGSSLDEEENHEECQSNERQQQQQSGAAAAARGLSRSFASSATVKGAPAAKAGAAPVAAAPANCSQQTALRLEVHLVSEHVSSNDYLVRNMYIINRTTGETRTISQFHYLAWPQNKVPESVGSFLEFRRKVHKSYRNLKAPILVHCSDGAGRSGTYTLIDIILERIRKGAKEIDPRATLEHLRDQRMGLCATQSQFEFVLVALAEEIQLIINALPH